MKSCWPAGDAVTEIFPMKRELKVNVDRDIFRFLPGNRDLPDEEGTERGAPRNQRRRRPSNRDLPDEEGTERDILHPGDGDRFT